MTKVYLADSQPEVCLALRLLLLDLNMEIVGETDNWTATLAEIATTRPDLVLVDWNLVPTNNSIIELRTICPTAFVMVLISDLETRQHIAHSAGADSFISKGETPDRVAERLRAAANNHSR